MVPPPIIVFNDCGDRLHSDTLRIVRHVGQPSVSPSVTFCSILLDGLDLLYSEKFFQPQLY